METDVRVTLRNKGYFRQPDGSYSQTPTNLAARLPDPEPQCDVGHRSLGASEAQKESPGRTLVRITRYGTKLVDFDNGAGGCKYLLDAIRRNGLIVDDSPTHIKFEFEQIKVKNKSEIGTEIIIQEIL